MLNSGFVQNIIVFQIFPDLQLRLKDFRGRNILIIYIIWNASLSEYIVNHK
jgi:hypothetical protein